MLPQHFAWTSYLTSASSPPLPPGSPDLHTGSKTLLGVGGAVLDTEPALDMSRLSLAAASTGPDTELLGHHGKEGRWTREPCPSFFYFRILNPPLFTYSLHTTQEGQRGMAFGGGWGLEGVAQRGVVIGAGFKGRDLDRAWLVGGALHPVLSGFIGPGAVAAASSWAPDHPEIAARAPSLRPGSWPCCSFWRRAACLG